VDTLGSAIAFIQHGATDAFLRREDRHLHPWNVAGRNSAAARLIQINDQRAFPLYVHYGDVWGSLPAFPSPGVEPGV
jgi:hypothetical protein